MSLNYDDVRGLLLDMYASGRQELFPPEVYVMTALCRRARYGWPNRKRIRRVAPDHPRTMTPKKEWTFALRLYDFQAHMQLWAEIEEQRREAEQYQRQHRISGITFLGPWTGKIIAVA